MRQAMLEDVEKWCHEQREQKGNLPFFLGDMRAMTLGDLTTWKEGEDEDGEEFAHIGDW